MKLMLILSLACLACCAAGATVKNESPVDFPQRQKDIYRLFKYVNQPSSYKDHIDIAKSYKYWENATLYTKPEVVQTMTKYWKYGNLLPRGHIFSLYYPTHLEQAIALFKLFYYAEDFETFYKTAVYARNNYNEGMFVYALSVALLHRPDTYYFTLPPIYEINPYYFYSSEVIQKAQTLKQLSSSQEGSKYNNMKIVANYSENHLDFESEQTLAYFMEDVGINAFYYYYNLYYPFWMSGDEFGLKNDNRSELFFYMYQQITARFYLERLSNGYGEIEEFRWYEPFSIGFYPDLRYPNGMEFPTRPQEASLTKYFTQYIKDLSSKNKYKYNDFFVDYEMRFNDALDLGYAYNEAGEKVDLYTKDGLSLLSNMIQGNADSPNHRYYGNYQILARKILGYSPQPLDYMEDLPSAIELIETSMRDPAFYMLSRKMMSFFLKYRYLQLETQKVKVQDLIMKGVTVSKVEFDRLITYFDEYLADLSNAVFVTPEEFIQDSFKVNVVQKRLTHKPFTYKVYVKSDKDQQVTVKVYLGPKYDYHGRYINLTEDWMNFVQFDHFTFPLKSGQNIISRNSEEIINYIHDRNTYLELYTRANIAYDKNMGFDFNKDQILFGFPQGFMLPKGSYGGTTYQFYVMVSPYVPMPTKKDIPIVGSGKQYVDGLHMGFPFNAPLEYDQMYYDIPNAYMYEAKVYHRNIEDINVSTMQHP